MERYAAYKDSGVEWIGEIPAGWEVKKLKYDVLVNPSKEGINKESDDIVVFLPMEKVKEDGTIDCSIKKPISELYSGFTFFRKNDVIIAKITPCFENGKGALLNELETDIGFGSTEFHVLRAKQNICNQFLYYITKSEIFMKTGEAFMSGAAGQKRVPTDFISDFPLASPSLEEQTAIANYLDRKTAEIDALITQKQRLIELYQEEKTALINQAVTRGIAPNAKLKDSGIDWLGEIPIGWEVKKLKHETYKIGDGIHTTPNYISGTGIFFINGVNLSNRKISITENTLSVPTEEYEKYKIDLNAGSILISLNGTVGNLAIYNGEKVIFGKSAAYIELKEKIYNLFLYYALQTQYILNYFEDSFSGTTIKNLSLHTLRNTPLYLPSICDQKAIVHHIETETARIDAKIAKTQRIIELQKEYRSALISEAVTGKIKVPDTAAQESGL